MRIAAGPGKPRQWACIEALLEQIQSSRVAAKTVSAAADARRAPESLGTPASTPATKTCRYHPKKQRPLLGDPGLGTPERKKPLDCTVSAMSRIEIAVADTRLPARTETNSGQPDAGTGGWEAPVRCDGAKATPNEGRRVATYPTAFLLFP